MFLTFAMEPSIHNNGILTEKMRNVFDHLGAPVTTLFEANAFAQKHLLRDGERWDAQAETDIRKKCLKNKEALLRDLRALGMVDCVMPAQKSYAYALIMGTLRASFVRQLDHLAELEQRGYVFGEIVSLGSARPLRDNEKDGLPSPISTEAQMMSYCLEQHPILGVKRVLFVNAPMIKKSDGTLVRPTSDSVLTAFSQIAPHAGSCLIISENPYLVRQTKVAQRILDQSRFPTQAAGQEDKESTDDIIILMDEFARAIYEESVRFRQRAGRDSV